MAEGKEGDQLNASMSDKERVVDDGVYDTNSEELDIDLEAWGEEHGYVRSPACN